MMQGLAEQATVAILLAIMLLVILLLIGLSTVFGFKVWDEIERRGLRPYVISSWLVFILILSVYFFFSGFFDPLNSVLLGCITILTLFSIVRDEIQKGTKREETPLSNEN